MPRPDPEVFAIVFAALGLLALAASLRRLLRARFFAAARSALLGLALVAFAALSFAFSITLHTYARLAHEEPVVQIGFESLGPQLYRATLVRAPSGDVEIYTLAGDEWQLDARVLKWRGVGNLLGLDARYRL